MLQKSSFENTNIGFFPIHFFVNFEQAMEYAKNIPKPRVPTPPEKVHERLHGASSRQQQEDADHEEAVVKEMSRLEELKERHMKEKQQVDMLRTEIPGT